MVIHVRITFFHARFPVKHFRFSSVFNLIIVDPISNSNIPVGNKNPLPTSPGPKTWDVNLRMI